MILPVGEDRRLTVAQAQRCLCAAFAGAGDAHPELSAEWLLLEALGWSRYELGLFAEHALEEEVLEVLARGAARRIAGAPLQYVTETAYFRGLKLACTPGVLIPRPETELLVEVALELLDSCTVEKRPRRVVDIGCGTGCIGLAIAAERPETAVIMTDCSEAAVNLAKKNRAALGFEDRVSVICCDLAADVNPRTNGTFSLVVSNPPYIPSALLDTLDDEVKRFEPALALDGGADGLAVFRHLLQVAPALLAPGGILAVELFEKSLDTAASLVHEAALWSSIRVHKDLAGRPRILSAVKER